MKDMELTNLVSIIIPNYNGREYLENCFSSLAKLNYSNYEIILVDNDSKDGSIKFTKDNYPQIKVIHNKKNLGFAEANNIGYYEAKGDYILFLNNDIVVNPNFLTVLVEEIEKEKYIGGVQPKILQMNNHKKLDCVGGFLTSTGALYHFGYGKNADSPKYNQRLLIFSMKGAAMLFKREVLEKVGLFDKSFFAYFEETDLCHRIWLAGYKIFYVPRAIIYHKGGGTSGKMNSSYIQFNSFKNRINSYIKNLGWLELLKILPLNIFFCLAVSIVYPRYFIAIHKAIWWNIRHIKETLEKRKNVQSNIRVISDKIFMPYLKKKVRPSYYYHLLKSLKDYED